MVDVLIQNIILYYKQVHVHCSKFAIHLAYMYSVLYMYIMRVLDMWYILKIIAFNNLNKTECLGYYDYKHNFFYHFSKTNWADNGKTAFLWAMKKNQNS